jgi:hypothetical protein
VTPPIVAHLDVVEELVGAEILYHPAPTKRQLKHQKLFQSILIIFDFLTII